MGISPDVPSISGIVSIDTNLVPSGTATVSSNSVIVPSGTYLIPSGTAMVPSNYSMVPIGSYKVPSSTSMVPSICCMVPSGTALVPGGTTIVPSILLIVLKFVSHINKDSVKASNLLLIPIIHNTHWTLIVGNLIKKVRKFYDSLPTATHVAIIPQVVRIKAKHTFSNTPSSTYCKLLTILDNNPLMRTSDSGQSDQCWVCLSSPTSWTAGCSYVNTWRLQFNQNLLFGLNNNIGNKTCLNTEQNLHMLFFVLPLDELTLCTLTRNMADLLVSGVCTHLLSILMYRHPPVKFITSAYSVHKRYRAMLGTGEQYPPK
ncbi:hypothetical protein M5K25_002054 [Dendrobium thyrsiflorum]|uniref:Uncharacterized protein n=1 Tax=Dendrobium thyrsiflorum TaxID=117978 RepID=A0ABD0VS21_DENTH